MTHIFAQKALLPDGWSDSVRVSVANGRIESVQTCTEALPDDARADCLVPGLCNAHSHAFQRALAGHTEMRSPGGRDNFWTWRERMYAFASRMHPERLHAVARRAYVEMLTSGYTSVAEFHYLHRVPGSDVPGDEMFDAVRTAAEEAGIRLTWVPVLYERSGFASDETDAQQRDFSTSVDEYCAHVERAMATSTTRFQVAAGAHSLRAVSAESLRTISELADANDLPMHIHIAEQQREVDQSLAHVERRPVRWLLENLDVNQRWCLVHATHLDNEEVESLAATEAVVCLCPSTEANLGDGLFRLRDFLERNGRIAIGSDSHISINPFEELRWLEYGQRLATQSRNVAALDDGHVGSELFRRVLYGGAQACGHELAGITAGAHADLVCLQGDDPMLAGHGDATRLDALVFGGFRLPIEAVMVDGEWCVESAAHTLEARSREDYANAVRDLAEDVR